MINLQTNPFEARRYTNAVFDYIANFGNEKSIEFELLMTALWWLSDDDVKRFAEVNLDITFDQEED